MVSKDNSRISILARHVLAAFDHLDDGSNQVTLRSMRELTGLPRGSFNEALNALRDDRILTLDSHEGRHVRLDEETLEAGITEGEWVLVYAARR